MPDDSHAELARRAGEVLERNRRGDWTCPSRDFYPHQWLWDSCFVAIGLARHDPQRAAQEVRALFRGQWANGMLPHMIFADGARDAGSRRIWRSKTHPDAPRDVETSCITQPPLVSVTVGRVAENLSAADRNAFLEELFPKLVAYHEWLYRERDPRQRGLVTLLHPWECGLDTTPPWMRALRRMAQPWWLRLALRWRLARGARLFRRDTRYLPSGERASDNDGLRMLVLIQRAKRHGFALERMPPGESVLIEDLAFNAFLAFANRSLGEIADTIGQSLHPGLLDRCHATEVALEELWDETSGQYYSRDAQTDRLIKLPTIATFLPLLAGVPSDERAQRLIALLREPSGFWPRYPVPSVATDAPAFDADRYWKGPTWVNTNWAIIAGLRACGEDELARELRYRTLELVARAGFSEYFSPLTGEGYGADDFSWTAALALDLVEGESPAP